VSLNIFFALLLWCLVDINTMCPHAPKHIFLSCIFTASTLLLSQTVSAREHNSMHLNDWINLTIFHVNPSTFPAVPINMDTADLLGDAYFDLRSVGIPIECQHPSSEARDCNNSEVVGDDLVITKLILEVDPNFGPYGRCNICVNGSDHHGNNSCVDGVYDCICSPGISPCGPAVGYENITEHQAGRKCSKDSPNWECWRTKVGQKTGGAWYSTTDNGYCGPSGQKSPNCTWRMVEVVKRVNKTCSDNSIYSVMEKYNSDCFTECSDSGTGSSRNTSSTCWITCFYDTILGPNSADPLTPISGIDLNILEAAWDLPFTSDDPAKGGCPAVP
jgi:hypothetical protein